MRREGHAETLQEIRGAAEQAGNSPVIRWRSIWVKKGTLLQAFGGKPGIGDEKRVKHRPSKIMGRKSLEGKNGNRTAENQTKQG